MSWKEVRKPLTMCVRCSSHNIHHVSVASAAEQYYYYILIKTDRRKVVGINYQLNNVSLARLRKRTFLCVSTVKLWTRTVRTYRVQKTRPVLNGTWISVYYIDWPLYYYYSCRAVKIWVLKRKKATSMEQQQQHKKKKNKKRKRKRNDRPWQHLWCVKRCTV